MSEKPDMPLERAYEIILDAIVNNDPRMESACAVYGLTLDEFIDKLLDAAKRQALAHGGASAAQTKGGAQS